MRAPNAEMFLRWKEYVAWCKDNGRDVCYLTLSLVDAFIKGTKTAGVAAIKDPAQVINLQMNNTFTYQVARPRRIPYESSCIRKNFRKTFSSIVFEAYVLNKAREINREFSFRDFLELEPRAFHRIVRRLIRKGKVGRMPERTIPRFYFLTGLLPDFKG